MPSDRIILNEMQFYGFHGANAEERSLGQNYAVDLEVELDLDRAGQTDHLEDTVSYAHLYRSVKEVLEGQAQNLLESLAHSIAHRILGQYGVAAVKVTVKKPHPPIKGSVVGYAAVQLYRARD